MAMCLPLPKHCNTRQRSDRTTVPTNYDDDDEKQTTASIDETSAQATLNQTSRLGSHFLEFEKSLVHLVCIASCYAGGERLDRNIVAWNRLRNVFYGIGQASRLGSVDSDS